MADMSLVQLPYHLFDPEKEEVMSEDMTLFQDLKSWLEDNVKTPLALNNPLWMIRGDQVNILC